MKRLAARAHLILLLLSAAALGVAFISQYGFGLAPCTLCWWQRFPYMAAILLSLAGMLKPNGPHRPLLQTTALTLLIGMGLGMYHTGVEKGVFEGLTGCAGAAPAHASIDQLRQLILEKPLVMCNQPAFVFLGLSMAAWNAVYSLFLLIITLKFISFSAGGRHER